VIHTECHFLLFSVAGKHLQWICLANWVKKSCILFCLHCNSYQKKQFGFPTYVIGAANLPLQTHCYLLPLLCQCLPVYDEICGRTMNFVRSCLYHQSSVVKSVAWYSVLQGRYSSPIGRNVSLCLQRYKCTFNDFLSCHSFKNIICRFVSASCTDDSTLCVVNYLNVLECEMVY